MALSCFIPPRPVWLLLGCLALSPSLLHAQNSVAAANATASELLTTGEAAYNAGKWEEAAENFGKFVTDYAGLKGTESTILKVKPLLAICRVRLGQYEVALPMLAEALQRTDLDPKQRADLLFFSGLANLRGGKLDIARQSLGEIFGNPKIEPARRMEALILGGMTYVTEKNWKEAASFFEKHAEEIRRFSPEAGARADILLLYALIQEKRWDDSEKLAREMAARIDKLRQVVTFSAQLIELGGHYYEEANYHKAIAILQLVRPKAEIERLQKERLAEAEVELKSASQAGNSTRASQIQTSIGEMEKELEEFAKVPQFDSAARLRIAGSYFQLGRIREGSLILDQMVRQMEPDAVVESATASLIKGWMSLERYSRAARTADLYRERFASMPKPPSLPEVMFLKAQALEGQFQFQAAADAYQEVATTFKDLPIASQANFMAAYNILQMENYVEAGRLLEKQAKNLKKSDEMWHHVTFWRAMAYYFDQKWDPCRKQLAYYLEQAPDGEYKDDAQFRTGYSYFSEARYPEAIKELKVFVEANPQSEWLAEGLLTLGDCLAAEGDLDEAEEAYAKISPDAPGFHDEGWMKRGNIRKAKKDLAGMKTLYQEFIDKRPGSVRVAEALQWLGWVAKQEGRVEDARTIYWDAIHRFGNDMTRAGLEDIFMALQSFYPGQDRAVLITLLQDELVAARATKKPRYATRLGWSLAQLQLINKENTLEVRQADYQKSLVSLAPDIQPKETAPRILADVGDALVEAGEFAKATTIYSGLRKWWPRAPERDRSYAGLGFIAIKTNDPAAALEHFDKYEQSSIMPKTEPDDHGISLVQGELGGKVAIARADLLSTRDPAKALNILLAVQKNKSMPARVRAEGFLQAARLHVKRGQARESLPYFEQVYLLFNRFPELVAHAYYERGEALEKLNMPDKAREVYSELARREELNSYEPAKLGLRRAEVLGGVLPAPEPVGGLIPPQPVTR